MTGPFVCPLRTAGGKDTSSMHPNCEAVNAILQAAGVPGRVRMLDEAVTTARAAAAYLGCPVGAIANSLIFASADETPLLIMTSGAHRVDETKIRRRLGIELRRASAEFVREHTGQPIGGVAPVGHPQPIRTLVDSALVDFDELWAAGGIPHAVFPLTYSELLLLTGGTEARVD